ncbi:INO80 chromatin remodeling complex Ies1 [Histoplasma capsulatum var. duboisii H88]|uniref:INO80 chromatin remodeling complex Ies1 n=1 Tax=Ajellomyces capsulatus (strain H88) TaxID=544711 RepID=F0UIK1_AJEC8|nr:INO80 chromatin remodeling complex Ies1 [Histoplasma capsulatum var. duboisii H88]
MASSIIPVSRDTSPRAETPITTPTTEKQDERHHHQQSTSNDPNSTITTEPATDSHKLSGAFEPEKEDHLDQPNGGYYAGSRKDFPLPADRYPLPRASVNRLLEPEPGSKGGRQRSYLDDPTHPIQGFWTESGTWEDWPPKSPQPPDGDKDDGLESQGGGDRKGMAESREGGEVAGEAKDGNGRSQEHGKRPPPQSPSQTRRSSYDRDTTSHSKQSKANANSSSFHSSIVSATVGTRRQANGTIGSVYSGNKIRHLKKDDGIPLWRKDIQYEFLKLVFEDKTPVFTRLSDGAKGLDFADIYIDAMARSSKTSKILKDKLQNDKAAAISMAMVCLLVNFGRMNTTLNFFPEMRAQLRTYHSIPSLQAHQDPNAYKQLQDAPRLKSILKGASEDTDQPNTIEKIKQASVPRTNPVNLIFVLSQYAPRISELHFFPPRDFFDLVMRSSLSSRSRVRAFLWLMWYYLESDFSVHDALNNPFGPGLVGEGTDGLPLKVPAFEPLTEAEADAENVDTAEEIQFGEEKQRERKRLPVDYASDDLASEIGTGDRHSMTGRTAGADYTLDDELDFPARYRSGRRTKRESSTNRSSFRTTQPRRLVLKTRMDQAPDNTSPAPPGSAHPVLSQFSASVSSSSRAAQSHQHYQHQQAGNSSARRPRPLTQHQLAVEQHRKQRVDYLLAQRRTEALKEIRARRQGEIPFVRAGRLLQNLPEDYDTDDEDSWGKGGVCPHPDEEEDYGEAAGFYYSVLKRAARRLQRWDWDCMVDDARRKVERDREREKLEEAEAEAEVERHKTGEGEERHMSFINGTHIPAAEHDNDSTITPIRAAKPKSRPKRKSKPAAEPTEEGNVAEKKPRAKPGTSSRIRQSTGGARKSRVSTGRSRTSGAPSAAGAAPTAEAAADAAGATPEATDMKAEEGRDAATVSDHLPAPDAVNVGATPSSDDDVSHVDGDGVGDGDEAFDDMDKELLGELSGEGEGKTRPHHRKRKPRDDDDDHNDDNDEGAYVYAGAPASEATAEHVEAERGGGEDGESERADVEMEIEMEAEGEGESDAPGPPSSPSAARSHPHAHRQQKTLRSAPPRAPRMGNPEESSPPPMAIPKPRYSSGVMMDSYRDSDVEGSSYLGDGDETRLSEHGRERGDDTDEIEEEEEEEEEEEDGDEGEGAGEESGEGDGPSSEMEVEEEEGEGEGDGDQVMVDA